MATVSYANQSGGCGKTTSATAIAASLAARGHKTRVWDLNTQTDASYILGYRPGELDGEPNLGDVLMGDATLAEATVPARRHDSGDWETIPNLYLVRGTTSLNEVEIQLVSKTGREYGLAEALDAEEAGSDWTNIIDCPGSLGLVMVNIMVATDHMIACTKPGIKELRALEELETTADRITTVRKRAGRPPLTLGGVLVVDVPRGGRAAGAAYDDAVQLAERLYTDLVMPTVSRSVRVLESYSFHVPITLYAPDTGTAQDYEQVLDWQIAHGVI